MPIIIITRWDPTIGPKDVLCDAGNPDDLADKGVDVVNQNTDTQESISHVSNTLVKVPLLFNFRPDATVLFLKAKVRKLGEDFLVVLEIVVLRNKLLVFSVANRTSNI